MATTTGNEYDHITISDGTNETVHYLKDTAAREDISDLKSAILNFSQGLSVSFTASGVRTWNLADTGMETGKSYQLRINSYSGANTLTRVTVRFYDSNTTLITTVGDNLTVGSVISFVVPDNAAKFRFLYYISASESSSASLKASIWQYRFDAAHNGTIACIGDSWTASLNGWNTFLAKQTGYTFVALSEAGSRMTVTYTSGSTEYKCFIDRVADGALDSYTPDLIVVFGGINDAVKLHNNQCRIGEITDTAEYSTSTTSGYSFIARVKYLINLIKTKKPGVPILGVLPPDYSEGTTDYDWWYDYIGQIRTALAEVYEYYGIPFVNLKTDCQEMYIDTYNLETYRTNGLSNMHPSAAGYKAIAKPIWNGINKILW